MTSALDLVILDSQAAPTGYVLATARRNADMAIATIPCDDSLQSLLKIRNRLEDIAKGEAMPLGGTTLKKFGVDMRKYIFRGDLQDLLSRIDSNQRLSLQVITTHEEFHKLPWEYMQFTDEGDSGPNNLRLFARVAPLVGMPAPQPLKLGDLAERKLKVLFVASDPTDQQIVHWDRWLKRIQEKTQAALGNRCQIRVIAGASRKDVQDALAEGDYDVLQFAGHGSVDANHEGVLIFKSPADRRGVAVRANDLADDLRGRGIRLAVLSACRSSDGSFSAQFRPTAVALIQAGIPAVVANQFSVPQETVESFLDGFYHSLLARGDIDLAVGEGRLRMQKAIKGDLGSFAWGIPTLYRLYDGAQLFVRERED
jgi:hypothetical protein